jgi:hypothetical protein
MASSNDGVRVTRLQDQTFVSGGTVSIQTAGQIPPGRDVLGVLFRLDLDITQPAAGQVAQLGAVLHQLISQVKIGRRVSISGLGLRFLSWAMFGREVNFPAGFPATASAVFSRAPEWNLWYQDPSSRAPNDGVIPSELWQDPIEVRFGTNAIFGATVPTLGNGTLRTYVVHQAGQRDDDTAVVPVSLNIQSEDFNALTATINKVGRWVYAILYREASNDAGGITSANVSNMTSYVDGEPILNNLRSQDAASVFNLIKSAGSSVETESQTAPVGGELNDAQPGPAAAAGQGTTIDWLPLLVPTDKYLVSETPEAMIGAKFELTGTIGAYKVAYRIVEPRPLANLGNAGRKLGLSNAIFEAKTHSKNDLANSRLLPFLPIRLRSALARR